MAEEKGLISKIKEFKLSSLAIDNKNSVFVITIIILLAGLISYQSMPKESFPEVVTPEIYVGTAYPGNSPLDIEKLITRPLEKEINSISGVDKMTSSSVEGYSTINVKFDFSVTPEEAKQKVKDKVDMVKSDPTFPKDLPADPNVFEMNISELMPIVNINLSGDFSMDQLKKYGEYLEDKIEDIPEITKVEIRGIQDKEVKIKLDPIRLEANNLGYYDVAGAIQAENMTMSAGDLLVDGYRRSVRIIGEFHSMEEVGNVVVKNENLDIVYLKDIATIEFVEKDKESYAREFGKPVVMLDVMKKAGENLLSAADQIEQVVEDAKNNYFPDNLEVSLTGDQSDYTRTQVDELENSIIFGIILVVLVLLFFLGFRNALFVGIAIPLSMLMSFFILNSMGVTLNFMVLFSLVMALGMLVDNGIVVVENIYRLMAKGMKPIQAAKAGVGEVATPIIASTATTLAAFLPLAFWPGMMGEFMKFLPITLMIVLGSSLFVALVINPVLTAAFMKIKEDGVQSNKTKFVAIISVLVLSYLTLVSGQFELQLEILFVAGAMWFFLNKLFKVTDRLHWIWQAIIALFTAFLVAGIVGKASTLGYIMTSLTLILSLGAYVFMAEKSEKSKIIGPGLVLIIIGLVHIFTGVVLERSGIITEVNSFILSGNFIGITGSFLLINSYILFPGTEFFQNKIIPRLEARYRRTLSYALGGKKPYVFLGGTVVALVISFMLIGVSVQSGVLKVVFFPNNMPQYVNIFIEKPIGTDIEVTNELTSEIEDKVIEYVKRFEKENPENGKIENFLVSSVISQVGEGTSDPMQGFSGGNTPHKGRVTISFVKFQERQGISTSDVLTDIRELVGHYPGVQIVVAKDAAGPPAGPPVNLEVIGEDYKKILEEAERVKLFIENSNVQGIEELKLDVEQGKPELPIIIDREKARRYGLSTGQIADALRISIFGAEISKYKEGEEEYDMIIRLNDEYRYDEDALLNQKISFMDQFTGAKRQVPISSVAYTDKSSTFSAVKRRDMDRLISVYSNVLEDANPNEVVATLKELLVDYEKPSDISFKFTGEQEEQAKEMAFLSQALIIALFLIFLIIVMQFNSFVTPFIVIISVVFSLIGVLLGLVIFRMDFVVIMTMIGIIALAGVVVNNAIVLIDYTKLIMKRRKIELGIELSDTLPLNEIFDCMVEGGKTRLRPVLLTAITTILGLIPLALGLNFNFFGLFKEFDSQFYLGGDNVMFWGPMSWTIIFGLTFATFLTLVIVPVMYYIVNIWRYNAAMRKKAEDGVKTT